MASERKWTPGPWERGGDLIGCYIEGRREWTCVAGMEAIRGGRLDEEEANANLIAAAPDLFEALEAIVNDPHTALAVPHEDKARAALAKARGETP